MTKGRILVSAGALAVMAAAALSVTFFLLRSDGTRPASSAPAAPTSSISIGRPANTIEEALGQARDTFTVNPPWARHEFESVVYVDTTVGHARDVFDPDRETPSGRWFADAPDDSPVWVVVAYGDFQWASRGVVDVPTATYTTVWLVVPKGELGTSSDGASNQRYDLSQLGTVVEVPVPLPPFPTPVTLDSQ